jgi:hypothetical protein
MRRSTLQLAALLGLMGALDGGLPFAGVPMPPRLPPPPEPDPIDGATRAGRIALNYKRHATTNLGSLPKASAAR